MTKFTVIVNISQSVPRLLVEQALAKRGTDLASYIEGGRKQGKNLEAVADELRRLTEVPFSDRTLYRWASDLQVSA